MIEIIGGLVGIGVLLFLIWAARYTKCGPNEVLIISGRRRRDDSDGEKGTVGYRVIKGGGTFVWPIKEQVRRMSLEIMNLDVKTAEVYSVQGVPISVAATAQVKVKGDERSILLAAENFLSRPKEEVMRTALQVVEGHTRATLSTLTPEEAYQKRKELAAMAKDASSSDLERMGLEIISLTIKDVTDTQGYLEAVGRPRTAQVKRDAQIGEARADEEAKRVQYEAETKVAESRKNYETRKSSYDAEMSRSRAQSDLAYDLERYKNQQMVKEEEIRVSIIEKELAAELAEKEILRKDKELMSEVIKPAEAEQSRIQYMADAEKYRLSAEGEGEALSTKSRGYAEADVIKQIGISEADTMMRKAEAWSQYNEAAITEMFVEVLPKMASAVSEPLAKTDKITIVSNDSKSTGANRLVGDVGDVISQLPTIVEGLTGTKLGDLVKRIPGLSKGEPEDPEYDVRGESEWPEPEPS
ncbi:MAG: flotillin family protein [Methanomassiliicoccales archaeon]